MRADGQVRFIKLSSQLQMRVAAGVVAVAFLWLVALAVMAWGQYRAEADLASFADEKARVAKAGERIKEYGGNLDKVVDDLKERQDFLDEMARMLPEDMVREGAASGTITDSTREAGETVRKVSALIPQAKGLAEIEARQLAFAERPRADRSGGVDPISPLPLGRGWGWGFDISGRGAPVFNPLARRASLAFPRERGP